MPDSTEAQVATDAGPAGATTDDLTTLSINTVRTLAMDAVQTAESGHPGMPMACAPLAYVLFNEMMHHDPADPAWWDRDRFVLSAGHGSMLLYAMLHLTGYQRPTLEEIRNFRQWEAPTAGHPEAHLLEAVETTTGPLGQGFANGVGMALAATRLAAEFNRPGHEIVDHRIYGIVSDGDIMEGVSSEAASLAGHLRLGNLVYCYDDNHITIDGSTDLSLSEDVVARFDAYGWHTERVEDANDVESIRRALKAAEADERPSLLAMRSIIGYGSPNKQGTAETHGSPLGWDEVAAAKDNLGWPYEEPFTVPDAVYEHLDHRERGRQVRRAWQQRLEDYRQAHPELAAEFERRMSGRLPGGWRDALPELEGKAATRKHSGAVISALAPVLPELLGGSADLAGSNKTDVEGGDFSATDRLGRNLRFGVREHAMGSMTNGIALHGGYLPYAATFLIFTDYARPSIRLAGLLGQHLIWVCTHDSIGLGEDGPTHQPIEHVASLRAIPNLTVFRPADGAEVVGAWAAAIEADGPVLMALTRQGVPDLGGDSEAVARGGYVLRDTDGEPDIILMGTGSELQLCVAAAESLAEEDVAARVVSLPSWELFSAQDASYRDQVLPPDVRARVSVEAAADFGWERWVGDLGEAVGLDRFGASAPGQRVLDELGFNPEHVTEVARRVLERVRQQA